MKIVRLIARNVKRLSVVEITPKGALVEISGPNGSGKSSVLDAIYYALAGKGAIDKVPVRKGEERAEITLDLGKIVVRRQFSKDGATSVTVEATDGARYSSPQNLLDGLLGALTFDPLEFSRMKPADRADALRKLVQIGVDVDEYRRLNARDYDARTAVNRRATELKGRIAGLKDAADAPAPTRIKLEDIAANMERAQQSNTKRDQDEAWRVNLQRSAQFNRDSGAELRRQIAQLEEQASRYERLAAEQEDDLAKQPPLPERVDVSHFRDELAQAEATNAVCDRIEAAKDELLEAERLLEIQRKDSEALTQAIDGREREILKAIADAKMPVAGLAFSDKLEVLFNDLPFEQASSAEQLKVSVAIAMAMNPELRILRVKDGALLDDNNLAVMADMAAAGDYQIWCERIEGGPAAIVMDNGEVLSGDSE